MEELKHNYDIVYGNGGASADMAGGAGQTDAATLKSYAEEIMKYCEIANELAGLSPEEYAQRSEQERLVDSMLLNAIDFFYESGGTQEMIKANGQYDKLDKERSRRLGEEFAKNHPEVLAQ